MNTQLRILGFGMLAGFGLLFANLNWLQVVRAETIASHPRNLRLVYRDYSIEAGPILSSDGITLAQSTPTKGDRLRFARQYPTAGLFAHIVGYSSLVYGQDRLERTYRQPLSGTGGALTIQELGDRLTGKGQKGDTLVLTVDSQLQKAASDAFGQNRGAAVAIEPSTGAILAMVSIPSFDPNPLASHARDMPKQAWDAYINDPAQPMLSRATSRTYPPGSTFKVVTVAAALEAGIGLDQSFPNSSEFDPRDGSPIKNFGGKTCGGDMAQALQVSCNSWFANLGAILSPDALPNTARAFGFSARPPLEIRTAESRVPDSPELRSEAFRAQSAIGQYEVQATPLQMALVAAGIANGGTVMKPHLVKEVRDTRGAVSQKASSQVYKRAIQPSTASELTDLMIRVVQQGTGKAAALPAVTVAGKTGTAQTVPGKPAHAWFIGFAPAADPRIAVAVVVEGRGDLGDEATGGRVAAPIAAKILQSHRELTGW